MRGSDCVPCPHFLQESRAAMPWYDAAMDLDMLFHGWCLPAALAASCMCASLQSKKSVDCLNVRDSCLMHIKKENVCQCVFARILVTMGLYYSECQENNLSTMVASSRSVT